MNIFEEKKCIINTIGNVTLFIKMLNSYFMVNVKNAFYYFLQIPLTYNTSK